jgi:rhodanese-related sulfurtransferase
MSSIPPLPPLVPATSVAEALQNGTPLILLDVRTPAEYAAHHLAQSVNLPLNHLPTHAATLREVLQGPTVLICRSGERARQAAALLEAAELTQIHVLEGGITAWEHAGLPVMHGQVRWPIDRQVRGIAGGVTLLSVLGGLFVWKPLAALAGLVGAGLALSAITDSCLMGQVLSKLPFNQTPTYSSADVVARLKATA